MASSTASMIEGARLMWLTRASAIRRQNCWADSVRSSGATITAAPLRCSSSSCTIDTSNPIALAASTRSPGPAGSYAARRAAARLATAAWLTATPLGVPVEPDV